MFVEQVRERASDWLIIGPVVGFTSCNGHAVHGDAHRVDARRQLAGFDQLGLHVLASAEVLSADRVPYTLNAAARVRQSHQLATSRFGFA
jgi:hypothetical protein